MERIADGTHDLPGPAGSTAVAQAAALSMLDHLVEAEQLPAGAAG